MTIKYRLYQIQPESECPFLFMSMKWLQDKGYDAEYIWYDLADTGTMAEKLAVKWSIQFILETLYSDYNPPRRGSNVNRPLRSMSVSDVVLLWIDGRVSAWYCDSVGFLRLNGLGWESVWDVAE